MPSSVLNSKNVFETAEFPNTPNGRVGLRFGSDSLYDARVKLFKNVLSVQLRIERRF